MRITSTQFRVVVTYTRAMVHGQTQQTYNCASVGAVEMRTRLEFGKPLVKRIEVFALIETMEKD